MTFPVGVNFDVARMVGPTVGVVGQFDWSRKSESASAFGVTAEASMNLTSFGGGIRWRPAKDSAVVPFVQALFGATRTSVSGSVTGFGSLDASSTDAMIQLGAGVSFPMSDTMAGVGQLDYRRIFFEGEGANAVRFVFGIRWFLK